MNEIIDVNIESVYNYLIENKDVTIEYGELENKCGLEHNPQNLQELITILNLTMMYNKLKNEPLLAALVVNKKGIPGKGFFRTLKYLGIEIEDENTFHQDEMIKIKEYKYS